MDHKRFILLFVLMVLVPATVSAQLKYNWSIERMDSRFDAGTDQTVAKIIDKYSPMVAPLQEIIGYSEAEYDKARPESGLSNFAADIIRETAEKAVGKRVDVGLTNFGGIRTSLPKGAVRVYDIFSIFPFDNYIVVFDIKGSDLRRFLTQMAGRRVEALSGVEMEICNRKPVRLDVGGAPIDDDRTYTFATINFLMDGGDGVVLSDVAFNREDTGIWIRDAIVDYLRAQMDRGEKIVLNADGRVKYVDVKEEQR